MADTASPFLTCLLACSSQNFRLVQLFSYLRRQGSLKEILIVFVLAPAGAQRQ